ncbi:hypothetical protein CDL15_Pgr016571 [Punica granatum]|uniref:Kinesin motor domain-containing protein n=1 Tax=Punica granatum TaxID=22663 RepID=A0A218XTQ0_PUNGR|nr:hypothetical protein CDL15_Pgr016571 [Punica granatum]
MSRDSSTSSFFAPKRSSQFESQENEFEASRGSALLRPPRTPLNSIPDPSQCQKETPDLDLDFRRKFEAARARRLSEKRAEVFDIAGANAGSSYSTPKGSSRGGKAHAESTSAQSTPARTGPRVSLGGPRGSQYNGGRGPSFSSRDSRGSHIANAEFSVECPHFELEEDSSFWRDHNVQVFIRIRPLSNLEKVSQGYGRCLRQESAQTLVWLGHPETRFTFDHVACETISQDKLFRVAGLPMVENCLSGYNSCMFAYGQTGSGKTYTMMGEINEVEGKLNEDCGITARIFEYLFARIRADEESRRDEKLMYSCKCSFLEIYNEQTTDLLEPSSTNLQLREDMKKGVYVENLTEYNVRTVQDVVKLLLQGAANRKMAATRMNGESSRSHSVFTCIIESSWEKDSMNHFRFARLNLVDLAGSERQKSSGAEGDRLKEAANINKSLSTLGLVIMTLVDLAHGKQRHVPYRDSRLTFLLQDSLGGNSKTMIIANVSPSICSANETLSTLKFAQRAKLIQNNAKVNEDASGDVTALQRQIQQLKGQLSFLLEHHNPPRSLLEGAQALEISSLSDLPEEYYSSGDRVSKYPEKRWSKKNIKFLAGNLANSLRKERNKDKELETLKAEIKHMNFLAREKEEDAQRTNAILKLREEKIQRLEMFVNGKVSADKHLVEENKALVEEIQLLRERIDSHPELIQLTLENNRLLQELQLYQNFYGRGERETLLAEISDLRYQLLEVLEGNAAIYGDMASQDLMDLQECQRMNFQLIREVEELRKELQKSLRCSRSTSNSQLEVISIRSNSEDEMASYTQGDDSSEQNRVSQSYSSSLDMRYSQIEKELMDAKDFIEAMEAEEFRLNKELQRTQEENERFKAMLEKIDHLDGRPSHEPGNKSLDLVALGNKSTGIMGESEERERMAMKARLDRIVHELEEVTSLNNQYEQERASQLSHQKQVELVCEQVEMETTRTIVQLQEEVATLQLELHDKLSATTNENWRLREAIAAQQEEMRMLSADWENATLELTNFLLDGSRSLRDVSRHIASIAGSFPQANASIGIYVEKAAITCIEKEETIVLLQRSLEDAQKTVLEMEQKLGSLKGATIALSEFQHLTSEESTEETLDLNIQLQENKSTIKMLEDRAAEAERHIYAAFLVVKWLSDHYGIAQRNSIKGDTERGSLSKVVCSYENRNHRIPQMKDDSDSLAVEQLAQAKMARPGASRSKEASEECYGGREIFISAPQTDTPDEFDECGSLVRNMEREASDKGLQLKKLRRNRGAVESFSRDDCSFLKIENESHVLHQIKDELRETNHRLNAIKGCIDMTFGCKSMDEDLVDPYELSGSYSMSASDSDNIAMECESSSSDDACSSNSESVKQLKHSELQSQRYSQSDNSQMQPDKSSQSPFCTDTIVSLRKELGNAFDSFNKQYVRLAAIFNGIVKGGSPFGKDMNSEVVLSNHSLKAGAWCDIGGEEAAREKFQNANNFLMRLEETSSTIIEANLMLNELTKANENAKCLTKTWKQTGEALMVERTSLLEEVERLKASLNLKKEENELLKDTCHHAFIEIGDSLSLLEGCFKQIQRDVDGMFKAVHADVMSMRWDILEFLCSSKSSMEDLYSEIMEKSFAMFVVYQCHVEHIISKFPIFSLEAGIQPFERQERHQAGQHTICLEGQNGPTFSGEDGSKYRDHSDSLRKFYRGDVYLHQNDLTCDNSSLIKELERKEVLLKGLLFDFGLLQESASNTKMKLDESEKLLLSLSTVEKELDVKTSQLDEMMVLHRDLEDRLAGAERDLNISVSDLEQANRTVDILSGQNVELRALLKDLYLKKFEVEEQLDEQKEAVKGLEEEVLHLTSLMDRKAVSSVESKENELKLISNERDQLLEEVRSLNNKLELAYALADENEAIAVEARQVSEASKMYAEQKEEEVKILEHSVEELEHTINMLEKKVYEMDQDVERHRQVRDTLELELRALRQRMSTFEDFRGSFDLESTDNACFKDGVLGKAYGTPTELQEAHKQIKLLEEERAEQEREIKRCKEYISEVVLHSEAQASQYQQKYKALEVMFHEVNADQSNPTTRGPLFDKNEKCSTRTRGSSSPFRCISSIVQQMNTEKDRELSMAKQRMQELEALAASQQKEVCMLNTRLAAAENMTHDVIRDLLGVKLDMTNYANFVEQHQVQKLVETAFQHREDLHAKEQEVQNLRKQIEDLIEERESSITEANRKEADVLATEINLEQLQQRDQLLSAQNEMLKVDKSNLKRRVAELDEMVKALLVTQNAEKPFQHRSNAKESSLSRAGISDLNRRLAQSEKLLNRANDELTRHRSPSSSYLQDRTHGNGSRRLSSVSKDFH